MAIITEEIDQILREFLCDYTQNSFGNQTLYDMCTKGNMSIREKLADEIWLIGRSYAVSPERRFSEREGELSRGRGTGDYFSHIAKSLIDDNKYIKLCEKISKIQAVEFDRTEQDYLIIDQIIQCTNELNQYIKSASKKFDETNNEDIDFQNTGYKNQISFCSKFLHFQKPKTFFIIDQYTMEGAKQLFVPSCRKKVKLRTESIRKEIRELFQEKLCAASDNANHKFPRDDEMKNYILHLERSYALGCVLKDIEERFSISKGVEISYPRLTDIIFQHVI